MDDKWADASDHGLRFRLLDPSVVWFVLAAVALLTVVELGRVLGLRASGAASTPLPYLLLLGWFATLAVAALATWQLVRRSAYASLLLLAALGLWVVEPGRAGEARTWRLEWGVFGLVWTGAAIVIFRRLLRGKDELERRTHLEGAAIGQALALVAAAGYALFEPSLPPLRAQWVAIALLLAWWCGFVAAARRYR